MSIFIRQHGALFIYAALLMTAFNYMSHGTQDLYATYLEKQRGFGVNAKSMISIVYATGAICGIKLPSGLRESDRLPEPIFTPAAKINTGGHDENISYKTVEQTIGPAHADALRILTLDIYDKATNHAAGKGLILADTKFEFGLVDDLIILADEVLTPDSSRYWPAATYNPGGPQPSFDKQYVRDYLESIHWNKQAPAPALPDEVVSRTREKYLEAFRLITGRADIANT